MKNLILIVAAALIGLNALAQHPKWLTISKNEDCNTLTLGVDGELFPAFNDEDEDENGNDNFYHSSGSEIIFSAADIEVDGDNFSPVVRFTAFFHAEEYLNYDFGNAFGLMGGLAVRNVGFIYDQTDEVRKKHRVYTLGIPVGFKLGKLDEYFLYGGYEIEFPFNYKEKTFEGNEKEKFNEWFSARTPTYYNSAFVGLQLPKGMSVKIKYYFTNFFDKGYTNDGLQPYENFNTNLFYISFGTKLARGK